MKPRATTVEFDAGKGRSRWRIHDGTPAGQWWSKDGHWIDATRTNMRRYATFRTHLEAISELERAAFL